MPEADKVMRHYKVGLAVDQRCTRDREGGCHDCEKKKTTTGLCAYCMWKKVTAKTLVSIPLH
jgi:hypothetical protein